METTFLTLFYFLLFLFFPKGSWAIDAEKAQELLEDFQSRYESAAHAATEEEAKLIRTEAMNQSPEKEIVQYPKSTMLTPFEEESRFNPSFTESGDMIEARDLQRGEIFQFIDEKGNVSKDGGIKIALKEIEPGRAVIQSNDRAENLVDGRTVQTLEEMEDRNWLKFDLGTEKQPWSGYYWAIYKGGLGFRYDDPHFSNSDDWLENLESYMTPKLDENEVLSITGPVNQSSSINRLSPGEKYDLLVGDQEHTLTKKMWEDGTRFHNKNGRVSKWMGICHGWAPAAYMEDRPSYPVKALAADGKTLITFYPSDIKSLASLLWANAEVPSRFIGGRCRESKPKTHSSGRVESQKCFDTNPGTWHKTVVNRIAGDRKSFIMDATYDLEVWNQPVVGYSYTYFNPTTMKQTHSLKKAMVTRNDFQSKDKFRKIRGSGYSHVVGVVMEVTYIIEINPEPSQSNSHKDDALKTVKYMYDLELNSSHEIIGGEWYTNLHPDFLWTPAQELASAHVEDASTVEEDAQNWDLRNDPVPSSWIKQAPYASAKKTPLAKVVKALILNSKLGWSR